jgi:uncharacterized protein HemX
MTKRLMILAVAGAVGLGMSVASAQQRDADEEPQEAAVEEQATEETASEAEPRSDEEAFSDHLRSFLSRVEERKLRNAEATPEVGPPSGFRYGPGW